MKKIMFEHRRFGLEQAVLERQKTMTRRGAKLPDGLTGELVWNPVMGIDGKGRVYFTVDCIDGKRRDLYPMYQIGEVVAVAQAYQDIPMETLMKQRLDGEADRWPFEDLVKQSKGYANKMYVAAKLMPNRIKITNIKLERMQDISDDDCRKEGIIYVQWRQYPEPFSDRYVDHDLWTVPKFREQFENAWIDDDPDAFAGTSPKAAFHVIIRKLMGKKMWDANPWVWGYEFELEPHRGTGTV